MKTGSDKRKSSRPTIKEESGSLVSMRSRQRTALSPPKRKSAQKIKGTNRSRLRCPNCDTALHQWTFRDVSLDECPACHGFWLDKGELAQASRSVGEKWIGQFFVDLAELIENPASFHEKEKKRARS